ncbi:S8 family serine peptidase [Kangiella sediminilitoris]|uniref:Peptidase S8 and S53 subtilisin kexin sedolisin n=1 Tax=Kangiella sediminilitoris TaxID=1144748 RepID=A0A1B3BAI8_9GAMM|nr:S8 family serine peptidase [Kangiella sediminilitoris]AOE49818.1 Peptidase S8 and S53 subtilisin kexin sedolisin [Kangiella sediminilitoris]
MKTQYKLLSACVLTALAGGAQADAIIGPELEAMLPTLLDSQKVIVTTHNKEDLNSVMLQVASPYIAMKELPMAGTTLNKLQIESLAKDSRVKSIYYDKPLKYYNYTSGEITGGHYVHDVEGVTGQGVTVAVLDSGVDGSHPDLEFGSKTIENVKILGDLDLATGSNYYLEGVINTDTSSGHGSHVAGTVAGTGVMSADDSRRANYHDGIAPDAKLVGLGAGEAISILFAIGGFDYAIGNRDRLGIDIITNSWGASGGGAFDPNNPINQASYDAYQKGMIVTFAAGNDGPSDDTINPYAIAPWVINVGAGNPEKGLTDFSSRGVEGDTFKFVDIVAPGDGIVSTRALNTPLPALGPIIDEENPDYYVYYASMSGTSMATPFVAGVASLLLEVNPNLSPDQVEDIIRDSADEMPGYKFHEVGGGYINVKTAVEMARNTVGARSEFMSGQTEWSSQGFWNDANQSDAKIDYIGKWQTRTSDVGVEGDFIKARKSGSTATFDIIGENLQLLYVANNRGGRAELFVDGENKGVVDFYSTSEEARAFAVRGLEANAVHTVQLKHLEGEINLDAVKVDGQLIDNGLSITTENFMFEGTMGPSAENLEFQDFPISVSADAVLIEASLTWEGVADLDFELLNSAGEQVASSASLSNPEVLSYAPEQAGDYVLRVNGYASVVTNFQIDATVSSLVE